jgi:hypothetical protein
VYFRSRAAKSSSALKKSTETEKVTAKNQLKSQKSVEKISPQGKSWQESEVRL